MIFKKILTNPLQFDVGLAEEVMHQVITHPESHNQRDTMSTYGCAQVGCIMGWVQVMAGQTPYSCSETTAEKYLGLTEDEFIHIYGEMNNEKAIARFQRYINYAKRVQAKAGKRAAEKAPPVTEPVHELSADDKAILDSVTTTKVGV